MWSLNAHCLSCSCDFESPSGAQNHSLCWSELHRTSFVFPALTGGVLSLSSVLECHMTTLPLLRQSTYLKVSMYSFYLLHTCKLRNAVALPPIPSSLSRLLLDVIVHTQQLGQPLQSTARQPPRNRLLKTVHCDQDCAWSRPKPKPSLAGSTYWFMYRSRRKQAVAQGCTRLL